MTVDWQSIRPFLTDLLLAVGLIFLGSVGGRYLGVWSRRGTAALIDRAGRRGAGAGAAAAAHVADPVPVLVGRFVYWLVFLVGAALAIQVLGFPVARGVSARLALYLPGALTAIAVVVVGVVVASLAGGIAAAASSSAGVSYAGAVGRAVQGLLFVLAVLVGLEQIGVHGSLLVVLLTVVVGVILAGAALAFGMGARTAVSNIVGAYYVAQSYRVGQTVRVGEHEGRIVRMTATSVVLDTRTGQVMVPARLFTELPSVLIAEVS